MGSSSFEQDASLQDHKLKYENYSFEFTVTADATPADKGRSSDISGVVFLRTEGQTSEADAKEDLSGSFTAPFDNTAGDSTFGVVIADARKASKVYDITVTEQTALSTSFTVTTLGTGGKTPEGNIAFEIAGTGLALDTESPTFLVEIKYKAEE